MCIGRRSAAVRPESDRDRPWPSGAFVAAGACPNGTFRANSDRRRRSWPFGSRLHGSDVAGQVSPAKLARARAAGESPSVRAAIVAARAVRPAAAGDRLRQRDRPCDAFERSAPVETTPSRRRRAAKSWRFERRPQSAGAKAEVAIEKPPRHGRRDAVGEFPIGRRGRRHRDQTSAPIDFADVRPDTADLRTRGRLGAHAAAVDSLDRGSPNLRQFGDMTTISGRVDDRGRAARDRSRAAGQHEPDGHEAPGRRAPA